MEKSNVAINDKKLLLEIESLKHSSSLEQGINEVLRMTAQGEKLDFILKTLCEKAQLYNKDMICSVLQLDNETNTLHPIASISLPKFYCDALDGVHIGSSVGSCGTAAYKKERVIVENIKTHPYWAQYRELALFANLQACWSEPIIGSSGKVFGTFAMYYQEPKAPTNKDLHFIEVSANLAAIVFESHETQQQLLQANTRLSHTIDQRNIELERANNNLEKLLKQQNDDHLKHIFSEKLQTTKSLVVGLANRINTPVSLALTSIGTAEQQIQKLQQAVQANKLSRSEMERTTSIIADSLKLSHEKLILTSALLEQFNDLSTLEDNYQVTFELDTLLNELKASLVNLPKHYSIEMETDKILLTANKNAIWKVLHQLIENSIIHGFAGKTKGKVFISASQKGKQIIINYQDNGNGIPKVNKQKVFEPYFTTKAKEGSSGLGLPIISSLLETTLSGQITLVDSPVGTRFEIILNQR